jgi:phage terminase small subunit
VTGENRGGFGPLFLHLGGDYTQQWQSYKIAISNDRRDIVLTAKQEKFAKNIMLGMTQTDAYRDAYNAKNMSANAIRREASLLMDHPNISQIIKEMRERVSNENIMTVQKRMEWLTGIINAEAENTGDRLKALDLLNKMSGEYVQKVQAEVESDINITVELSD